MTKHRAAACCLAAVLLAAQLAGCSSADKPVFEGNVNVGVAPSSPGWNNQDPAGHRTGFDYDLVNWLGQRVGFTPVPVNVITKDRETALAQGTVALIIATYSMSDERRKHVDFVGPYMLSSQGIMVRMSEREKYRNVSDLHGRTVCATRNSTSVQGLRELGFPVTIRQEDVYKNCLDLLTQSDGQIDAISTDQAILFGLKQGNPDVYIPSDIVFGLQEQYGIGLPKNSGQAKCEALRGKLSEFISSGAWDTFFNSNFPGVSTAGHRPDPAHLDRC
jgi:glutamate transport system substrate-binding protein